MEMNFCRRCGEKLKNIEGHVFGCDNQHIIFANCSPSVGVFFINNSGKILLSKRGIEPHKGMLDVFGGFLDGEETVETALEREIYEETGLKPDNYEKPTFLCSSIGHYPYKNELLPVLSLMFYARIAKGAKPKAHDDVAEIVEIGLDEIDLSTLHADDIRDGVIKLRELLKEANHGF